MDFLKDDFNDSLNEDGEIVICKSVFTRAEILEGLENETYNIAFEEWKDERKKEYIDKFDNDIANLRNGQKNRYLNLERLYLSDQITPFIGAGMSILSGYEAWTDFLYSVCDEYDCDKDKLDSNIKNGDYYIAAEELLHQIGQAAFQEKLDNTYDKKPYITGAIRFSPFLFKKNIITTNFDKVIETLYTQNNENYEVISGEQLVEAERHLSDANLKIFKIHGRSTSPIGRVLTYSEYKKCYTEEAIYHRIIESFAKNSLLFLGCSLINDEVIKILEKITEAKGSSNIAKHYAFLKCPEDTQAERELKLRLSKCNIFPIWYGIDHDEAIEALFWKLYSEKENL